MEDGGTEVPGVAIAIVQATRSSMPRLRGQYLRLKRRPPETLMMIGPHQVLATMLMGRWWTKESSTGTRRGEILPSLGAGPGHHRADHHAAWSARASVPAVTSVIFNADEQLRPRVIESLATFEFFTDFGEAFQCNQMVAAAGYIAALAAGGEYGNSTRPTSS